MWECGNFEKIKLLEFVCLFLSCLVLFRHGPLGRYSSGEWKRGDGRPPLLPVSRCDMVLLPSCPSDVARQNEVCEGMDGQLWMTLVTVWGLRGPE